MSMAPLDGGEARRYARQLVLRGFGGAGQQALKAGSVLVVGAGGLGSPAIAYLAAAGIGRLGIVDDDQVALSNLQRQIIHDEAGIGTDKVASAARFAAALNAGVRIETHRVRLSPATAQPLIKDYDLVLDGTDNLGTRRAVAQAARAAGKMLVSGAVSMFDGQLTVFSPDGPDFTALYPEALEDADMPDCEVTGIMGPVTGVIGALMAMEAIKILSGGGEPLVGRLLLYDGRRAKFTELGY
ncbi:molybdopterin-synthase adenylyltransferase MoeB [Arsenicitalea aurantiaca]|uniref:Molybdopterin-synthase adenylyltransferase MoeB n=1 Tax=Arsenicitalea aurantiaca TaxID=1783274 RepID=A0A433X857_9HYPH|nr:molybdopterin-synthase adenylyltransferase MoeB [Arsenicitalea aurantiaca]RUT30244.1 molybdopterin-synthase adenylyltransferase MoeB [Arsenicitalea aurantiaca]